MILRDDKTFIFTTSGIDKQIKLDVAKRLLTREGWSWEETLFRGDVSLLIEGEIELELEELVFALGEQSYHLIDRDGSLWNIALTRVTNPYNVLVEETFLGQFRRGV